MLGVFGAADIGAIEVVGMATQADGDHFARLHDAEWVHNRVYVATRIDVGLAGPVAAFATGIGRFIFGVQDGLVVRIAREVVPDSIVLVAFAATFVTYEAGLGRGGANLRGGEVFWRRLRSGFLRGGAGCRRHKPDE